MSEVTYGLRYKAHMSGKCECCNEVVWAIVGYTKFRAAGCNGVVFQNTGFRTVYIHYDCAPIFLRETFGL